MIDLFSLALSHGLLLLAAWRLVQRPDLDSESPVPPPVPPRPVAIAPKRPPHA